MRMPSRVQRCTSFSVSSIVTGDGGYWKYGLAVLDVGGRLAVGDHDDLLACRSGGRACVRASSSACCMFVPHSKSQVISGQQLGLHLAGDAAEAHQPEVVARELAS